MKIGARKEKDALKLKYKALFNYIAKCYKLAEP